MKRKNHIIAMGLTASMTATLAGCYGIPADYSELLNSVPQPPEGNPATAEPAGDETAKEEASEGGNDYYNVLFITVDQQHYFAEDPEGTNWKARQLLSELGTTKYPLAVGRKEVADISPKEKVWIF